MPFFSCLASVSHVSHATANTHRNSIRLRLLPAPFYRRQYWDRKRISYWPRPQTGGKWLGQALASTLGDWKSCTKPRTISPRPIEMPMLSFWTYQGKQRLPKGSVGKESTDNAGDKGNAGLIPGSGRSPGGRKWQPTPVFFPGESHGQRSLAGYSPMGHKESDTIERLSMQHNENAFYNLNSPDIFFPARLKIYLLKIRNKCFRHCIRNVDTDSVEIHWLTLDIRCNFSVFWNIPNERYHTECTIVLCLYWNIDKPLYMYLHLHFQTLYA